VKTSQYLILVFTLLISGSIFSQTTTSNTFSTGGLGNNNGFPPAQTQQKKTNQKGGLDDSTKVIYGPTSSRYFLEEDVFNNRKKLYTIDTLLKGFHNYSTILQRNNTYVDLGLLGTASRPLFYQAPDQLGTRIGYDAYSLYAIEPKDVKYYNTRSPYSDIYYVTAGKGQDILDFDFNRNIDSLWNVGLTLHRITSTKPLVGGTTTTGTIPNAIGHWEFMLHSNYQSKNKKYTIMGYLNRFDHNIIDEGGVARNGVPYDSLLLYDDNNAILTSANSRDTWNNVHVYHEYAGYKAFQIFQTLDYESRKTQFVDKTYSTSLTSKFYASSYLKSPASTDTLYNGFSSSTFQHKSGIKGFYKGFNYRLHFRQRILNYTNLLNNDKLSRSENFVGVWLNQYLKDSTRFFAEGEYHVGSGYRLNAELRGKWLNFGGTFFRNVPTLAQQYMYNSSYRWLNDTVSQANQLKNLQVLSFYANGTIKIKNVIFSPFASFQTIDNYIYFDQKAVVKQSTGSPIAIFRAGGTVGFQSGKFTNINNIYWAYTKSSDLIRMPAITINSRLALDILYAKVLYIQAGLELYYKSGYYGDAYMPATQQFYLQDTQYLNSNFQADIFADMRINRVRVFFKLSHANQRLLGTNGYYIAPGYAGIGRTFGFGVRWLLFD